MAPLDRSPLPPPGWTRVDESSTYIRPLVGHERAMGSTSLYCDGQNDVAMGFTFSTDILDIVGAFVQALIRLRLFAPLIAADIVPRAEFANAICWSYSPLNDFREACDWATATLQCHDANSSSFHDLLAQVERSRLPHVLPNGRRQYFRCHLFLDTIGEHAVIIYGSHAVIEGQSGLWAFRHLFSSLPGLRGCEPPVETSAQWGAEVENLPVSIDYALEAPLEAGKRVPVTITMPNAPEWQAVIQNPTVPGGAVRIARTIDASTFSSILEQLRAEGISVSALCDAAQVLAIAEQHSPLPAKAQVTRPYQPVALQRFLRAPYKPESHITSCLAAVPLFIPLHDLPARATARERLLAISRVVKAQYASWLTTPDLLRAAHKPPMPVEAANASCPAMSNLGDLERYVPRVWKADGDDEKPFLELTGFNIGMRVVEAMGSISTHAWTFGGKLFLQTQAPDTYDVEYLTFFMDRIVANISCILDKD